MFAADNTEVPGLQHKILFLSCKTKTSLRSYCRLGIPVALCKQRKWVANSFNRNAPKPAAYLLAPPTKIDSLVFDFGNLIGEHLAIYLR